MLNVIMTKLNILHNEMATEKEKIAASNGANHKSLQHLTGDLVIVRLRRVLTIGITFPQSIRFYEM